MSNRKFQSEADIVYLRSHFVMGVEERNGVFTHHFTASEDQGQIKTQGRKIKLFFTVLHELPICIWIIQP